MPRAEIKQAFEAECGCIFLVKASILVLLGEDEPALADGEVAVFGATEGVLHIGLEGGWQVAWVALSTIRAVLLRPTEVWAFSKIPMPFIPRKKVCWTAGLESHSLTSDAVFSGVF